MIDQPTNVAWADRLPRGARLACLVLAGTTCLLAAGFVTGLSTALFEQGRPGVRGVGVLAAGLFVTILLGLVTWQLSAPWRAPGQSAFARRYTRMWLILVGLGIPVGIILALAGGSDPADVGSLFTNGPLDSRLALLATGLLLLSLTLSAILYHRAIDDHEEQAYFRATTGAFYFLAAALPAAWLLVRGGIMDPLGLGSAMLILLGSLVVQTLLWGWFKFR